MLVSGWTVFGKEQKYKDQTKILLAIWLAMEH